jgi:dCMP deaminase
MRINSVDYFMDIAEAVSKRATCDRAHVGCVIVSGRRIIATGFNGSPSGMPHCDDVGHDIKDGHCIRTIHAEVNAILQCAIYGISIKNSPNIVAFCNYMPCLNCIKMLVNVGIHKINFEKIYGKWNTDDIERLASFKQFCDLSIAIFERNKDGNHLNGNFSYISKLLIES